MEGSIQTSLSQGSMTDSGLGQDYNPSAEMEFSELMLEPAGPETQAIAANIRPQTASAPAQAGAGTDASISTSAARYAKAFGGADGFGGDGHDRAKLASAGLTYATNGPTSIQDVLGAAGNQNQFHISADGQAQTQRVFALAEAEGMTQDGVLSATELTDLKNMIQNPALASTDKGQALASAIKADAAQSGSWTGSAQTAGSSSAPQEAGKTPEAAKAQEADPASEVAQAVAGAQAAGQFNFMDWLMNMMNLSPEQILSAWKVQESREQMLDQLEATMQEAGMSDAAVENTLQEFSQAMDNGDVAGATSIIEGAMNASPAMAAPVI